MKIKLSRILKIISTILIAVGIAYLFLFVLEQNRSVTDILDKPSYYAIQNYKMLFLSGIAAVACAVLGSFFSWSEKIDPREQVLMNAGYTSAENIDTWLKGSTAEETSRTLKQTIRETAPVETNQKLKQTFRKPFVAPSTVVLDFEPSETIKKIDEIAAPEAEKVSAPAAEPEIETVPEVEAAPEPEVEAAPEVAPAVEAEPVPEIEAVPEVEAAPEPEAEPEPEEEEEEEAAITETLDFEPAAEPEPEEEEEEEAAITETLDLGDDEDEEEEVAHDTEIANDVKSANDAEASNDEEAGEGTEITEILDNDDEEEAAITETLEDDSDGKEADA